MTDAEARALMAAAFREQPAFFANKFAAQSLGTNVRISFGESLVSDEEAQAGVTLEEVFKPRASVLMSIHDVVLLRDMLNMIIEAMGVRVGDPSKVVDEEG